METLNKKKVFSNQNIPNILLISRMIFAVVIVVLILLDSYSVYSPTLYTLKDIFIKYPDGTYANYCSITTFMLTAGILFVVACITDFLDGYLARKNHWVSDFGKFWDPVADKVLINSTMIAFAWHSLIPVFIPIIMIARDVIVDADRMIAAKKDVVIAANFYGKLKTVLQMVSLILIFFIFGGTEFMDHIVMWWVIQNMLVYVACVISVMSGIIYFKEISKALKAKETQNASDQQPK